MDNSLLTTKLYPTPLQSDFVARKRLLECLNLAELSKITLVSAPAGFGKSTLVTSWGNQNDSPVAWLKLDKRDNQDTGFISYLYASLRRAYPDLHLAKLPVPTDLAGEQATITANLLLNEIALYSGHIFLVLDDYHLIENGNIHAYLEYLIEHFPTQAHIILITRIDPPLPLSRWRGRGELNEIRAVDLKFNTEEIEAFIHIMAKLRLGADQLALIEEKTEGWITGIKLAVLSLSKRRDFHSFSQSLSGNQEYIADYLTDEVLNSLPPELHSFLLQTSILNYLSGELCNAVTDRDVGQAILERLVHENLFLSSLDETRTWYQYHQLFADLLRKRLYQTQQEQVSTLFKRAINWHEQHGLITEAVQYAVNLKDEHRLISLMERHILDLILQGEFQQAHNWLDELSPDAIWERPILCVASAWVVARNLTTDAAYTFVDRAEELIDVNLESSSPGQRDLVLAHILTLRPLLARTNGVPVEEQEELFQQALEVIPENNTALRGLLNLRLGLIYLDMENETKADRIFKQVIRSEGMGENYYNLYAAIYARTVIAYLQGRLNDIQDICLETLQQTEERIKIPWQKVAVQGFAHIALGLVELEWNHQEKAGHHLQLGLSLNTGSGLAELQVKGQYALGRLALAKGMQPEPIDRHKFQSGALPHLKKFSQALQAHLWLLAANGGLDAVRSYNQAVSWAAEQNLQPGQGYDRDWQIKSQLIFIRIVLAMRTSADAQFNLPKLTAILELLESELISYYTKGWVDRVLETMIVKVLVQDALGNKGDALSTFQHALQLAQPSSYVRIFLDEGDQIIRYLYSCADQADPAGDYARFLLAQYAKTLHHTESPVSNSKILIEPLTPREEEVLSLLARGFTNNEVCQELSISLGTVKRHIANINGKLNTDNRTRAVAVARKLKIIH